MIARGAETTSERGRGSQRELLFLLHPGEEDEQKSTPKFEQRRRPRGRFQLCDSSVPPHLQSDLCVEQFARVLTSMKVYICVCVCTKIGSYFSK